MPSPTGTSGRQPDGAGRAGGATGGGNDKTKAIQQEIDATVGIMQDNIRKVTERGARLDTLQDQTGESQSARDRYVACTVLPAWHRMNESSLIILMSFCVSDLK